MFERNYYCLVAGLREYALDSDTKGFDAAAIVADIVEELSSRDAAAVRLLYGYYDCENIIALRAGRSAFNSLGNLTREELAEELSSPRLLPEAVRSVIRAYNDPEGEDAEGLDMSRSFENALLNAYYEECARSKSGFLREWSDLVPWRALSSARAMPPTSCAVRRRRTSVCAASCPISMPS